ncbi:YbjN domain-containing protein [Gleimia hominis]|uniref:YbjN domain-containing protein n=1 Tax=Gleimia hominis TaxID=595468 RepID=A0ABU3I974_9ACTO|nr:YbjN domain-containing protein [Gleimia hominis]MDT3766921.1 YbjN domain-containing protein [Gleimia hominis]
MAVEEVTKPRVNKVLKELNVEPIPTEDGSLVAQYVDALISVSVEEHSVIVSTVWRGLFREREDVDKLLPFVNSLNEMFATGRVVATEDKEKSMIVIQALPIAAGLTDTQLKASLQAMLVTGSQLCDEAAARFPHLITWKES